jgi:isopenicillin-N N-acyltransferase-like protein
MAISLSDIQRSAQSGDHHVYRWSGSPYEIGRQHGQALRHEIVQELMPALQSAAGVLGWSEARVLDRHRALYETVFEELVPRAVEEIKGLAQGAELSYEQAFFAATRDGAKPSQPMKSGEGCTAFFCGRNTTRDANILMGQTKDTPSCLSRYRIMQFRYDDGLRIVQLNYPGWIAHIGLSSHGLANTGNSLYAQSPDGDSVPFSLLKRLVMERKTIEDVLAAVSKLQFENCCVIIGSSSGHGLCIEFVAGRRSVREISQHAYGHANAILDRDLQSLEEPSADTLGNLASSRCRQNNVQDLLNKNKGQLDLETLKHILSDHTDYPNSICRHGVRGELRTTSAFIADLTACKVHLCIGNPCVSPFQEYSF